ncbi:MAG: DUF4300 family protein [Bacilli bacterium]
MKKNIVWILISIFLILGGVFFFFQFQKQSFKSPEEAFKASDSILFDALANNKDSSHFSKIKNEIDNVYSESMLTKIESIYSVNKTNSLAYERAGFSYELAKKRTAKDNKFDVTEKKQSETVYTYSFHLPPDKRTNEAKKEYLTVTYIIKKDKKDWYVDEITLVEQPFELTYTNLVDDETFQSVSHALSNSGVSKEQIRIFQEQVNYTNDFLGDWPTFAPGFTTKNGRSLHYDETAAFNLYNELKVPYFDINCRVAAWNLIHDVTNVSFKWDSSSLEENFPYEMDIIQNNPNAFISLKDAPKFFGLFGHVEAKGAKTTADALLSVQKEWKKRGITFEKNDRTLITAHHYDEETNALEISHTGVLLTQVDGLLFIEKYNPTLPFQVTSFKTRDDLKKYLLNRLDIYLGENVPDVLLMENDHLLE